MNIEEARRRYTYDPDTGMLSRRQRQGNYLAGSICVSLATSGHIKVRLGGKSQLAHRVAWAIHTGEQPPDQIDHVDLDKTNNKWVNLRSATASTNQMNITKHTRNQSGYKGVMPVRGGALYRAEVCINGQKYQKHGKDPMLLDQWARQTRELLHLEFTRH